MVKTGIGQDSHRFDNESPMKPLILAGVEFPGECPLRGNSDADVVLHAVTNAISGITGVNIIGAVSDELCLNQGITDSRVYLSESLKYLNNLKISHVSISIECKRPKISPHIGDMKSSLATLLSITPRDVGITATSGEELTDFGKGKGIQAFAIVTAESEDITG
ncbi:MAG: 2-C-methyl-D-erythritol 2,4-cyclodiphosphate synthase [Pseudomonadota bacterium]